MTSPLDIENIRKKAAEQIKGDTNKILDVNLSAIQNATPGSLKPQGNAKLSGAITSIGKKIYTIFIPIALNIAKELGASIAQEQLGNLREQIISKDGCPTDPRILELLAQRNNLVVQLNRISRQLDRLIQALTGLNTFFDISQIAITAIKLTKTITSTAVKIIPSPPGTPGIITSTLSDLETIINKLLFSKIGEPKLPKVSGSIAAASLAVSIVNGYIQLIIAILTAIDIKLKQCSPNLAGDGTLPGLTPISSDLISISLLQTEAEQTQNGVTYAGFVIEIEEVPYTPTVNRRRAVGKNQSGIKLIQTELSFTTQDEILINELKLIIDRDNLKAY
jgi:hypothetical protein